MSNSHFNSRKILDLIHASVRLANNVRDDIQEQRSVSDDTIHALNVFMKQHEELSEMLDLIDKTIPQEVKRDCH